MNPPNPRTPEPLDRESLRGILFLCFFGALIGAKCALSEALRLRLGFDVDSALFIWLPSLVIGGAVAILYLLAPGSPFHPYWRSRQFLLPAGLVWLTGSFSIVRNLPSPFVVVALSAICAVAAFVLGRFQDSTPVRFLAAVWFLGALAAAFLGPERSYFLFAFLLVAAGAIPSAVGYFRLRPPPIDR
jgi:hypothetical protein